MLSVFVHFKEHIDCTHCWHCLLYLDSQEWSSSICSQQECPGHSAQFHSAEFEYCNPRAKLQFLGGFKGT